MAWHRPRLPLPVGRALALLLLSLGLATSNAASADVPREVQVQGRLLSAIGAPQVDPVEFVVGLFTVETGGVALYEETHASVAPQSGLFELTLGRGSLAIGSFDETTFASTDVFLEFVVDGEALVPRIPFRSAAYALRAQEAVFADDAARVQGNETFVNEINVDSGLLGGGTGSVSIEADPSQIQMRVQSACPENSAIGEIAEDGNVNCVPVDEAGVSAGAGLLGSGGDPLVISIDPSVTQQRVASGCQAGAAIRSIDESGGVVCDPIGAGSITEIVAGAGLNGGGTTGTVGLSLSTVFYPAGGPLTTSTNGSISTAPNTHQACVLSYTGGGANCLITGFSGSTWSLAAASRTGVLASCRMTCF